MTALLSALALVWIALETTSTPCSCDELTIWGAGNAAINGVYTYTPSYFPAYWEGTDMWLGPFWKRIGEIEFHWALLNLGGTTWVCGVTAAFDGTEHAVFVVDGGYYTNPSQKKCPPQTGWETYGNPPVPTITRDGCLCLGIGDVNNDGSTDLLDARLLYAHLIGTAPLPAGMLEWADVDEDGDVDQDDARILSEQLIGMCL